MLISDKILYLRKKTGYTQEELAEQLNVSRQSISKWEGRQSIPDVEKIKAMATLFSVSTDYLLRDEIEELDHGTELTSDDRVNRIVTLEESNKFIKTYRERSVKIAIGVALCITAGIPILAMSMQKVFVIGSILLFLQIVVAIGLFIYSESLISDYQYIIKGEFDLSYNVSGVIKEEQSSYKNKRTKNTIINIGLLVLSPVPLISASFIYDTGISYISMVMVLLIIVAVAMVKLIYMEGIWESYDILLSEGDYTKDKIADKKKREIITKVYWSLVLAIYLIWSFVTNDWHISWIVWLIGGVLSNILELFYINDKISTYTFKK